MSIVDLSTNQLFVTYTVEEIRKLEKETRAEIETKKEDLRQMVGERYRDLIEAADTITEMKNCSGKIVQSIQNMQKHCVNLQKTHSTKGISLSPKKAARSESQSSGFYAIASQTKLLLDIPEKIWSDIESGDHLHATQLYLLACHIVSSLQLDTTTHQSTQLLKWFPVLSRQWAAICHFKPSILQSCRNVLKNGLASDMVIAKALCSIMLLEDSSPRQVFTEFLLARKNAVHQAFSSSQFDASVKKQVCGVTNLIKLTLRQIHAVFYHQEGAEMTEGEESNLLLKVLTEATSTAGGETILAEELTAGTFTKHLPTSITDFHPSLRSSASPIAATYLQDCVSQWIETCINDVHDGISKLLSYVASIRGLTSIRDAVWELLQESEDVPDLSKISKKVLGRSLCLWGEFVRPLFLTRIEAIIQDSLDQTLTNSHQLVIQASQDMDSSPADLDVAAHTWKEISTDLPSPLAWRGGAGSRDVLDAGSLYMKARAFTPKTQSICSFIDVRQKSLLEDLGCYTDRQTDKQSDKQISVTAKQSQGPFDKFADTVTLHSFLQIACTKCVTKLAEHIRDELSSCKLKLTTAQDAQLQEQSSIIINRVVFLGRLCSAMTELSPHLQQAVLITEKKDIKAEQQRLRSKVTSKRESKTAAATEDEWSKLKTEFRKQCQVSYRIWSEFTSTALLEEFNINLRDTSPSARLKNATAWDSIEIEEETEEGRKVSSKIRLPVQSSWYVQSLLYGLCEEVNRIGGHALSRDVVSQLVKMTSSGLFRAYQAVIKERSVRGKGTAKLSQPQALQLLFDVRFIASIMSGRGDDKKDNSRFSDELQGMIDKLEGFVDPFDLDVFTPHMTSHLNRHVHRSSLLLGFLTSPDRHMFSGHRSSSPGYQEQHNVLPLTSSQVRFSLLPLSTTSQSSKLTIQPAIHRQKQILKSSLEASSPMDAILHKSRSSPASLSSRLSSSLKSGWLSNLGGQS